VIKIYLEYRLADPEAGAHRRGPACAPAPHVPVAPCARRQGV